MEIFYFSPIGPTEDRNKVSCYDDMSYNNDMSYMSYYSNELVYHEQNCTVKSKSILQRT